MKTNLIIPVEQIQQRIFLIRGQKVMLDFHLAQLYSVPTKSLNLAVKRNIARFPEDFMFRLTSEEYEQLMHFLRFQFETSKKSSRGGRRYLPYVFTEQGVAMLSSVLRSERAVMMNVAIMRAFVSLRELLSTHKELAKKLFELEQRIERNDEEIRAIYQAIRELMKPPEKPRRQIGFKVEEPKVVYHIRRRKK
jgi:phage regulator Rha-like protein